MKFKQWLKKEDPLIFEIGANNGSDTVGFFEEFENPILHCFEPHPEMYRLLVEKVENIVGIKPKLNNVAISNKNGTAEFHLALNNDSSSLKLPKEHLIIRPDIPFPETIMVKTITLDDYMWDNNILHCNLVYMDVQGAEDLVFDGGKEFFKECVDYIYTEFSNIELYESAPNKEKIYQLLPYFSLVEICDEWWGSGNMLLINNRIK